MDERPLIVAPSGGVRVGRYLGRRVPAVGIAGPRIVAAGGTDELRARLPNARIVTCGAIALPGFRDAHLHFFALAAHHDAIDCSPERARDIPSLVGLLRREAEGAPGEWVRAVSYDHRGLAGRRHPHRLELDEAVPRRPLILRHRSGHAAVLNSAGLAKLGIDAATPHPRGGSLERDASGGLSGLVIDGERLLRERGLPSRDRSELARLGRLASDQLARAGVTWFCDAGPHNDIAAHATISEFASAGLLRQRWTLLEGAKSFQEEPARPSSDRPFPGVKFMVGSGSGAVHPDPATLTEWLEAAHLNDRFAAVHAVDEESIAVALLAFEAVFRRRGRGRLGHRIEHASECPRALADWMGRLGLAAVVQPGLITALGDYQDGKVAHLYPFRELMLAGVSLAGSSDAPAGPLSPLVGIDAAVRRRTPGGRVLARRQALRLVDAVGLFTSAAARWGGGAGTLEPGDVADLVLLRCDPFAAPMDALLPRQPVCATLVAGRWAYVSPELDVI